MWKTCLGLEVGKMDGKEKRDTEDIIWVASEMMWGMEAPGAVVPPGDWIDVVVQRLHTEPWALAGAVVIAVFVLGILALAVFAFLFGCCCTPKGKRKKSRDAVL
ncbi:unnamed protein product [Gadus morhua 'NCC']